MRLAIALSILLLIAGAPARAESDKEVEAHKAVLDLAGAFSNDGFKMRRNTWRIQPGKGTSRQMRSRTDRAVGN